MNWSIVILLQSFNSSMKSSVAHPAIQPISHVIHSSIHPLVIKTSTQCSDASHTKKGSGRSGTTGRSAGRLSFLAAVPFRDNGMADNKCFTCTDRKVVAATGLKGQGYRPNFSSDILIFGRCTASLECAPVRLCHGGPSFQWGSYMWSNCPRLIKLQVMYWKKLLN